MKLRHHLFLTAIAKGGLAVFSLALPLFVKTDEIGFYFAIGLGGFFALMSFLDFKNARETREQDQAFAPPVDATVVQQIAFYKKFILASTIAFPILTLIIALELNALESGQKEKVYLWVPVSMLYDLGGFWLAVLSLPLLGILCCGVFLWKISTLKKRNKEHEIHEKES